MNMAPLTEGDMKRRTDLPPPSALSRISAYMVFPIVLLAEAFGIASVALIGVWMGKMSTPGFGWDPSGKLDVHPFVMTLGTVFIFGNATLVYRVLGRLPIRRSVIKTLHGGMMLVVLGSTGFGLYLVFMSIIGKNFATVHCMLGILTTVLLALQFIVAVLIFVLPCAPGWLRKAYLHSHAFFGLATLVVASATCLTGISSGAGMFYTDQKLSQSAAFFIVAFCCTVGFLLTKSSFRVQKEAGPINHNYLES